MVYENTINLLNTPVGFRGRPDGKRPTRQEVENWIMKEKPNQLAVTTYGTYGGVGLFLAGLATAAFALFNRNKTAGWISGILSVIGAGTAAFFKLFSVENNLFSKLIDKFVIAPTPAKDNGKGTNSRSATEATNIIDINKLNKEPVEINMGKGGILKGCFLPATQKTNKTIIFLNGRGHTKNDALHEIKRLQGKANVNFLVVDYRGFDESKFANDTTRTTKSTMVEDSIAMFEYLTKVKKINPEDISVFGASLGGHIAIELSTRRKFNTLVIQSSFTTVDNTVKNWLLRKLPQKWAEYLAGCVKDERFDSTKLVDKIQANKVIVSHGTKDTWISFDQGKSLHDLIVAAFKKKGRNVKEDVHFIELLGGGHTDFVDFYLKHDEYVEPLVRYCADQPSERKEKVA